MSREDFLGLPVEDQESLSESWVRFDRLMAGDFDLEPEDTEDDADPNERARGDGFLFIIEFLFWWIASGELASHFARGPHANRVELETLFVAWPFVAVGVAWWARWCFRDLAEHGRKTGYPDGILFRHELRALALLTSFLAVVLTLLIANH